jgi:Cu+-exporting ATPase
MTSARVDPDRYETAMACDPIAQSCCSSDTGERLVGDLTWFRVGIALAFSGQGMVFGLGYNNALRAGEGPAVGSVGYGVLHGVLIASALVVVMLLGVPLFRSAWAAIRQRQLSVEALFLLTATGAFIGSVISTVQGEGSVYYEVVGLVLVIYTVGRKVGATTRRRALATANEWRERFSWAQVATDSGNRRRVHVASLQAGDRVRVLPGELIPVDGKILHGQSEVQETILSGEVAPVLRRWGHQVHAGSYALDGRLDILPDLGSPRLIDEILQTVEAAVARPSRFQTQADRLIGWFLPMVVAVSVLTFAGWFWGAGLDWPGALFNAMAVLLVACPCALGLATPIAVWNGLLVLSQSGLVSRDGRILEALANSRTWFFDKTGTLSEAVLKVDRIELLDKALDVQQLRAMVASVEAGVPHPIARTLAEMTDERLGVADLKVHAGCGLSGTVLNRQIRIGRPEWIQPAGPESTRDRVVDVSIDGERVARIHLMEFFPEAHVRALSALSAQGAQIRILSGDPDPGRTSIAGITVEGGLSPAAKAKIVREAAASDGLTFFVGDGLNDAAALASAPFSIGLQGGAELSQASASGVLLKDSISVLPWAVAFCRRLQKRLRENLIFALCYNTIGMSLAAAGALHPVVAAILMLGSSVVVSWRTSRISRWANREAAVPE